MTPSAPEGASPRCFCRDCLHDLDIAAKRCRACGSPRLVRHRALAQLTIAHIDCDAFYATVEKRDDPELADKPVIIGGGKRGVVSAACYIARTYGVRSAMPMFKALALCPHATVIRPDMAKYVRVGREVRQAMLALTPLVEPLSIDEAFLDLGGTERLHGMIPAKVLARFAAEIERDIGITVSIGLSCNKFLAKIASDLDKPRGFAPLDQDDGYDLLTDKPVGFIFGVGPATQERLAQRGFRTVGDLQRADEIEVMRQFPSEGRRLWRLARGLDERKVVADRGAKTISSETTFETDLTTMTDVHAAVARMAEAAHRRLVASGRAARTVTVKARTADFATSSRSETSAYPSTDLGTLTAVAQRLARTAVGEGGIRLIGVSLSGLDDSPPPALFEAVASADGWTAVAAGSEAPPPVSPPEVPHREPAPSAPWRAGDDVAHTEYGHGWVQGAGHGRVTVRFETRATGPGSARTLSADDPALTRADPMDSWTL